MNLERDLAYSERSKASKWILITIVAILSGLLILSLFYIFRAREEVEILKQQILSIQKEKETTEQRLDEALKENGALRSELNSLRKEKEMLAKKLAAKKATSVKKRTSKPRER